VRLGWNRISDLAISFGLWLSRIPLGLFVVLSAAIVALKSPIIPVWVVGEVAEAFPEPVGKQSNVFVGILLWRLVGGNEYFAAVGLLAILAAVVVVWLCSSSKRMSSVDGRSQLLLALTWPPVLSGVAWFGYGTEFFPLGIAIAVLTQRKWIVAFGAVLASLSHPEIALASFTCLLVLSLAQPFGRFRLSALIGLLVSAPIWVASTAWMRANGAESRLDAFAINLREALEFAVSRDLLGLYAGWGIWWIVIIGSLGLMKRRDALITVVAAVGIPFLAMSLTLDGNRVFAGVGAATGLAVLWQIFETDENDGVRSKKTETAEITRTSAWTLGIVASATLVMPFVQYFFASPLVGFNWPYLRSLVGSLPLG